MGANAWVSVVVEVTMLYCSSDVLACINVGCHFG